MHRLMTLALPLLLALAAAPARVDAQQAPAAALTLAPAARVVDARLFAPRAEAAAPALLLRAEPASAARERPWWRFPLIGAAAGALIGLAIDDGCGNQDCIFSIPPTLLGAAYGSLIGAAVELAF